MRSPARPRSAISFRSAGPISRPIGILPAAKVFQLPPPAVEVSAVSGGMGCVGGGGLLGGAAVAEAAAGAGVATATAEPLGVAALATWIGVGAGDAGFCATTGACDGAAVGAGVALPLASFV